jgi:EAL domain-containing protein (putative c-di-GMP-specific phosphodiesterase class I)
MYRAKDSGRARHEIFDSKMHSQILDRLEIENDLRRAIERDEFLVYYQPILALKTEKITGFEALMRWNHPDKGLISPVQFIPIAEETGLIVPMGEWVFQEACSQMFAWQSQFPNLEPLTITINLSGKQFREPNLLQKITEIIDRTGLEPKWVKLEITESMLMHNVDAVTLILCQLREMQIQLSIDDFGTGYSSLSYLQRFPVNTLKIDRCFIKQIEDNGGKSEIVEAIINLAHTLNMDVTAEGIETPRQLEQLKLLGCEQGQGFLFSKPVDKRSAAELLSRLGVQ